MTVHSPVVTLIAAGLLGLVFLALSARVVIGRTSKKIMLGTGGDETLPFFAVVRGHANFAEFVPFCLVLLGGLEIRDGSTVLIKVLAAVLVLARIAHPIGMGIDGANPFRAAGFVGTMLVIVVGSVAALLSVF